MRADARLQRLEARLGFGAHARAPLLEHIEIAQQRGADQRAQCRIARSRSAPGIARPGSGPGRAAGRASKTSALPIDGDQRASARYAASTPSHGAEPFERRHAACTGSPRTTSASHCANTLAVASRGSSGRDLVARRNHDDEHQQFGHDHHREQHRQAAKIRQPAHVAAVVGRRRQGSGVLTATRHAARRSLRSAARRANGAGRRFLRRRPGAPSDTHATRSHNRSA